MLSNYSSSSSSSTAASCTLADFSPGTLLWQQLPPCLVAALGCGGGWLQPFPPSLDTNQVFVFQNAPWNRSTANVSSCNSGKFSMNTTCPILPHTAVRLYTYTLHAPFFSSEATCNLDSFVLGFGAQVGDGLLMKGSKYNCGALG